MHPSGGWSLQPVVETEHALAELGPIAETDPRTQLLELGDHAAGLVPSLVGLSLAYGSTGVVFTLVASDERIALLDAMQYVDGGPCVAADFVGRVVQSDPESLLDEGRWTLFARASAAAHVRSTLTIPVLDGGRVSGTVNMYAGAPNAFVDRHEALAELFGGWAAGTTRDADLSFSTRDLAREAPERLRDEMTVERAVGIVAGVTGQGVEEVRHSLEESAMRAGVGLVSFARAIVETQGGHSGP